MDTLDTKVFLPYTKILVLLLILVNPILAGIPLSYVMNIARLSSGPDLVTGAAGTHCKVNYWQLTLVPALLIR